MTNGTTEVVGKKIVLKGVSVQDKLIRKERKFLILYSGSTYIMCNEQIQQKF
jgi:hypothetical protein